MCSCPCCPFLGAAYVSSHAGIATNIAAVCDDQMPALLAPTRTHGPRACLQGSCWPCLVAESRAWCTRTLDCIYRRMALPSTRFWPFLDEEYFELRAALTIPTYKNGHPTPVKFHTYLHMHTSVARQYAIELD